jgi:hypothetical protein
MKPELSLPAEARTRDALDLAPRFTEHDAVRLNRLFRGSSTQEMLTSVIRDGLAEAGVIVRDTKGGEPQFEKAPHFDVDRLDRLWGSDV